MPQAHVLLLEEQIEFTLCRSLADIYAAPERFRYAVLSQTRGRTFAVGSLRLGTRG